MHHCTDHRQKPKYPVLLLGVLILLSVLIPGACGFVNTGTFLGMCLGGVGVAAGLLPCVSAPGITLLLSSPALRYAAAVILVAALVGTILVATLCGLVITGMFPEKCDADVLIVLGCLVDGENPSLSLLYRLNAAERYLKEHPDAVCILSGGQGDREDITEALCMYRVLTGRGIAPSRLYLEERSTNTFENLRFSREVMEENGIEGSICLVTNSFHLYRARLIAGRQGMTCGGLAASSHLLTLPLYIFREAAGIMWLTVFGYE